MKKELKRKYLPFHYRQDIFLKIQNLKQQNLIVEEYSADFENLLIKGELQEAEEQSIARYLASLRFKISKTVQLRPYNTLQDVIKLTLKVKALSMFRIWTCSLNDRSGWFSFSNEGHFLAPSSWFVDGLENCC